MKKIEMENRAGIIWPQWEGRDEIPALSEVYEEEGRAIYKSKDFLLAMEDGSFQVGAFEIFLDDNGESKKCGWCTEDDALFKMHDIFAWGPLPKHPLDEEEDEDD